MEKKIRIYSTYILFIVLFLVVSVSGWGSMVPGELSVKPTVIINQAIGQADPTNTAPIHFTVVFSKVVKDFRTNDVTLTGTAPGILVGAVTGSDKIYDVAVTGMTGSGTVIANIAAGVAHDAVGNDNKSSTSTDNIVTYDITPPTVTINQAANQADPTNIKPIHFTVVFSEAVTDFAGSDVTITGTAPGTITKVVTGSGTTYNVAVTGMTGSGTVIANIAAGVAHDTAGNGNVASTSTDNVVTYDVTPPTVTINQAVGQADPTNTAPIHFTVVFSEVVTDFTGSDVTITGTAPGTITKAVTGSGTTYDVAVSGMTDSGTVIANIAAGVTHDLAGNASLASTSTDNTVMYDITRPTVTINQYIEQADPTNTMPIRFTVVFSKVVTDFATGDVALTGTAHGTLIGTVTGSGTTYDVAVTGLTGSGTVIANIIAGVAHDGVGNANKASTSTDNIVTYDIAKPTVTINQAASQIDPTNTSPIHFTVIFSKVVTDFDASDVTLAGTAPGTLLKAVTGSGTTYDVLVSGMTGSGTITAKIVAGVAHDAVGNDNKASTSTDNTVTYDITPPSVTINQAVGQPDPTVVAPIRFTVVFSEAVTDFATGDVSLSGTAPGTLVGTVTGSGATYTVAVTGMTGSGTVIANLAAGVSHDAAGNASLVSTSIDNTVTYNVFQPISIGFGAFGGSAGVTNQGIDTIVNGDIGTTAASTLITGFHDSTGDKYTETPLNIGNVTGRIYTDAPPPVIFGAGGPFGGTAATKAIADAVALAALNSFNYLKGLPTTGPDPSASGELSGLTLAPGVYKAAGGSYNIQSGGTLTLDALGDANAIWVFQMNSSLTVGVIGGGATPAKVVFKNGVGQAKNVFWQVGSAATINTGTTMVGNIIASAGVSISTAGQTIITTLNGRAISLVASVTMVNTHINVP